MSQNCLISMSEYVKLSLLWLTFNTMIGDYSLE